MLQHTVMRDACFMGRPKTVGPPVMAPFGEGASSRAMVLLLAACSVGVQQLRSYSIVESDMWSRRMGDLVDQARAREQRCAV